MEQLPTFLSLKGLPQTELEIVEILRSSEIKEVRNFVLGPRAISNIPQACQRWLARNCLTEKATLIEGRIPDEYLLAAQAVNEPKVVPLYWTCAVFGREKDLFFGQGVDTLMFFVQEIMPLDHMQLAILPGRITGYQLDKIKLLTLPSQINTVASHASPKPLLDSLLLQNQHCRWVEATSNGAAAEMVLRREVDICITTETARSETGLVKIHDFGCPPMVFFGGLTKHGANTVLHACRLLKSEDSGGFPPSDMWPC